MEDYKYTLISYNRENHCYAGVFFWETLGTGIHITFNTHLNKPSPQVAALFPGGAVCPATPKKPKETDVLASIVTQFQMDKASKRWSRT